MTSEIDGLVRVEVGDVRRDAALELELDCLLVGALVVDDDLRGRC